MVARDAALQRAKHGHRAHAEQQRCRHEPFSDAGTAAAGHARADALTEAVEPFLQLQQLAERCAERKGEDGDDRAVPIEISFYAGADQHEADGHHDPFGYAFRQALFCEKADQAADGDCDAVYDRCYHSENLFNARRVKYAAAMRRAQRLVEWYSS